jgi:hypothetical protein
MLAARRSILPSIRLKERHTDEPQIHDAGPSRGRGARRPSGRRRLVRVALGSDHQDTPLVELNPTQDMTDVYAFPGSTPGRIALVLNSRAFLTPAQTAGASFDNSLLYQFKIDNNGDAKEDKVIQVTFNGTGTNQTVEVRGPVDPPVQGAMGNKVSTTAPTVSGKINTVLGTSSGMQMFAGPRDDPFFIRPRGRILHPPGSETRHRPARKQLRSHTKSVSPVLLPPGRSGSELREGIQRAFDRRRAPQLDDRKGRAR